MTHTIRLQTLVSGTCGALVVVASAGSGNDLLYDNGPPNYDGGYSNAVEFNGGRRTLLDDFVVPKGESWSITGLQHLAVWNTMQPGTGTRFELAIRADHGGEPGEILFMAQSLSYEEEATGRIVFDRPEYQSWHQFEAIELGQGTYWLEGTAVGPVNENNFWLITGNDLFTNSECWINYEDIHGLEPGSAFFQEQTDLNFQLIGTTLVTCHGDIDGSGTVGFTDLLAILGAWGPCDHPTDCPEDLDNDGHVDFADILLVLSAWGPC